MSIEFVVRAGLSSGDILLNKTVVVPVLMEDSHKVYAPEENVHIKQQVTLFMILLHFNLKLQKMTNYSIYLIKY